MINRIDWGERRQLAGGGPGYLLLRPGQVLDLRTGPPEIADPGLRDLLHGFRAMPSDSRIYQLAGHLAWIARMGAGVLCDGKAYQKSVNILIEVLKAAVLSPDAKTLEREIGEFSTIQRVAWYLLRRSYPAKDISIRFETPQCKLWTIDQNGTPLAVTDGDYGLSGGAGSLLAFHHCQYKKLQHLYGPELTKERLKENLPPVSFIVRTSRTSPIANCAEILGRVPTKGQLAGHMRCNNQAIRRWCRANGFQWLPQSSRGSCFGQHS